MAAVERERERDGSIIFCFLFLNAQAHAGRRCGFDSFLDIFMCSHQAMKTFANLAT